MTSFRIVKEGLRPTPFSTQLLEVFYFFPSVSLMVTALEWNVDAFSIT